METGILHIMKTSCKGKNWVFWIAIVNEFFIASIFSPFYHFMMRLSIPTRKADQAVLT